MLELNEYVHYGDQGICQVTDMFVRKFQREKHEHFYYVLRPLWQKNVKIFVPKDNDVLMNKIRPTLKPKEIDTIIFQAKNDGESWIEDPKRRYERFRQICQQGDTRDLLKLVICLYCHTSDGFTKEDGLILRQAQTAIEKEFAFSLGVETKEVGEYIQNRLSHFSN